MSLNLSYNNKSVAKSSSRKPKKESSLENSSPKNYNIFDDDDDDNIINKKTSRKNIYLNSSKIITEDIIIKEKVKETSSKKDECPIISTFNTYFPGKTIKPIQLDIMKSIINKKDTIGILPTGYGKSVCYQLPFLMNQSNIVIVISPLISLMEDQKDKLDKMNISCECFHSNVNKKKKSQIRDEILDNMLEDDNLSNNGMIIFLTPEYLVNCENFIKSMAEKNRLSLVAIDEAHCISTWGSDFRPNYQGLYRIKEWTEKYNIPILALTATATKHVEEEIKSFLQLDEPKVFKTSFDRPNLIISVETKPKEINKIFPILEEYKNDFSIIYCKTREKAEEIKDLLLDNGFNAGVYHAGLTANNRKDIQEKFSNKELNIIVATVAFGMGIDQNIHLVIHWGCPCDMESYYQEIGRAGRDNVESKCIMFYNKDDFRISRYFLKSIDDLTFKKFKDEQISKMERYCLLPDCRRLSILTHFGENLPQNYSCEKCDNCKKQNNINKIATDNLMYPIYIIAKTIFTIRCKFGTGKIALIAKGSKAKNIAEFNRIITYGLLKELTEDQIKTIINILIINCYLKESTVTSGFGTVLETTSKLVDWFTKVNYIIGKNSLTFDNLQPILNNYKLNLNIPSEYNNITKIKFKTTVEQLITEFEKKL